MKKHLYGKPLSIYLSIDFQSNIFTSGNVFNEAMASRCKQQMQDFVKSYPHIFDDINSLVDVGGGTGTTVKIIAKAFPMLRCTVLDLPHVVAKASEDDLFNVVAGDMFKKLPPADAFLLKVNFSLSHNYFPIN